MPHTACLTASKARQLLTPELLKALPAQLPSWTVLALVLCALRHGRRAEKRMGDGSASTGSGLVAGALDTWGSYVDALPATTGVAI